MGKDLSNSREDGEIGLELMSRKKFYHWINFRAVCKLCTLIRFRYNKLFNK